MRTGVAIFCIACTMFAAGQAVVPGPTVLSGNTEWSYVAPTGEIFPSSYSFPEAFVCNTCSAVPNNGVVMKYIGSTCPLNGGTCNYPETLAGLQQSMTDWCAAPDQYWHVLVQYDDPGITASSATTPWVWCSKAVPNGAGGYMNPTQYILYESDAHLRITPDPIPVAETVCSHGIQDPGTTPALPNPGYRNPGCNGALLGEQQLEVSASFSNPAYNDQQYLWTLNIGGTQGGVSSLITMGAVNANTGYGPNHIVVRDMNAYPDPGLTASTALIPVQIAPVGNTIPTAPSYVGIEHSYIHADADEYGVGNNFVSDGVQFGCSYCWFKNNYMEGMKRESNEGHTFFLTTASPGPTKIIGNWIEGSAIGWFSGGGTPGMFDANHNAYPNSDVEIRRNRFTAPIWWGPSGLGMRWSTGLITQTLTGGTQATVAVSGAGACPPYSLNPGMRIQINNTNGTQANVTSTGTYEVVVLQAGTSCAANATSGTYVFTPVNNWPRSGKSNYAFYNGNVAFKNRWEYKDLVRAFTAGNIFENDFADAQPGSIVLNHPSGCVTTNCLVQNDLGNYVPNSMPGHDVAHINDIIRHSDNSIDYPARAGSWVLQTESMASATCSSDGTQLTVTYTSSGVAVSSIVPIYIYGLTGLGLTYYNPAASFPGNWYWPVSTSQTGVVVSNSSTPSATCTPSASGTVSATNGAIGQIGSSGGNVSPPGRNLVLQNVLFYDIGNHNNWAGSSSAAVLSVGGSGNDYSASVSRDNTGLVTATITAISTWPLQTGGPANTVPPLQSGITGAAQSPSGVGDLVYLQGCSDSSFNTGAQGSMGIPASNSSPSGTVIQWQTSNLTPSTATCPMATWDSQSTDSGLYNKQGGAPQFYADHLTLVGTNQARVTNTGSNVYQEWTTLTNSIQAQEPSAAQGGIISCTGLAEGDASVSNIFDIANLVFHHWAFTYRSLSKYTSYPSAGNPVSYGSPGYTLWAPTSNSCPTSPATSACIGFSGAMSGGTINIAPTDYHYFALDPTSVFKAGASQQASDGTDLGAHTSDIDTEQSRPQYVCPIGSSCYGLACGSGGPCPDN